MAIFKSQSMVRLSSVKVSNSTLHIGDRWPTTPTCNSQLNNVLNTDMCPVLTMVPNSKANEFLTFQINSDSFQSNLQLSYFAVLHGALHIIWFTTLTLVLWSGTILHPLLVSIPSSEISRATWSPPNVIGGAISYSCRYFLFNICSRIRQTQA